MNYELMLTVALGVFIGIRAVKLYYPRERDLYTLVQKPNFQQLQREEDEKHLQHIKAYAKEWVEDESELCIINPYKLARMYTLYNESTAKYKDIDSQEIFKEEVQRIKDTPLSTVGK